MDHPEAVVAPLLHRIKEVASLVPKGNIVEENVLKKRHQPKINQRFAPTSNELCELRFPKLKLVRKYSPF